MGYTGAFLYAPYSFLLSSHNTLWDLVTPYDTPLQPVKITRGLLYLPKTTYAPMIYTSLCVMIFDAGRSITCASGRGLGPGNLEFFGPKNGWNIKRQL
jgi:hypothetical protein